MRRRDFDGLGDYLSERAENDYIAKEQAREEWEMENYLDGEISEMADIYVSKGFSREDALEILNKMVKTSNFFRAHDGRRNWSHACRFDGAACKERRSDIWLVLTVWKRAVSCIYFSLQHAEQKRGVCGCDRRGRRDFVFTWLS